MRGDSDIKTIADLVAQAKANPAKFNYSSPGAGTKSQLTGELLKLRAGIQMVHVPFRGAGPAAQAVLANTVQVGSVALAAAEPLIKDGQLRALAVTSEARWFSLPDVPTMIEVGVSRFHLGHFQRAVRASPYATGDHVGAGEGKPRRLRSRRCARAGP